MTWTIRNGRLLDPASNTDCKADVVIDGANVIDIVDAGAGPCGNTKDIDATDLWVTPGFIDLHVHLREPGQEYKEDIASGSLAAVFGGFTTIVAMPNTQPVIDNAELVAYVRRRGEQVGLCRVLATGAVTMGQKSEQLAPFGEMRRAGAVGLTDDGLPVVDPLLMRHALEYSRDFHLPIMTHAEECALSQGGHMHEGEVATRLGIPGIPRLAEDIAVERDIQLAQYTGGHLHVCHVSTAGSVASIRRARAWGARVTGEATPHHFSLTHNDVDGFETCAKMSPPLREESDRLAVIAGLKDGTLGAIATDHAPHSSIEKEVAFAEASNGVIGLETALPLSLNLWRDADMPPIDVVRALTSGPAEIIGRTDLGRVTPGGIADIALIDPNRAWQLNRDTVRSKSHNSPFLGCALRGRVEKTIFSGKIVYEQG